MVERRGLEEWVRRELTGEEEEEKRRWAEFKESNRKQQNLKTKL
jgi:hypothetical protein